MRHQLNILLYFFLCLVISCKDKSLKNTLDFTCKSIPENKKNITLKDAKKTFELSIPENWKRELFVDTKESRFYCADTTRELTEAYIFDLGYFETEINFDSILSKNQKNKTTSDPIFKSGLSKFKTRDCFYVFSTSEKLGFPSQKLTVFFKNQNNSHYKLNIDVYGDTNTNQRFCEGLDIFESVNLFQN
ncbi:hypothetical protein [Flavicella sediminum]|uniref:hypothetical protein n=1 Tax=Flavicella sediminum TaxID=2585141 RepID=UPI00112275EC|nr:hypothetical protein [Flavicella sediminum]